MNNTRNPCIQGIWACLVAFCRVGAERGGLSVGSLTPPLCPTSDRFPGALDSGKQAVPQQLLHNHRGLGLYRQLPASCTECAPIVHHPDESPRQVTYSDGTALAP